MVEWEEEDEKLDEEGEHEEVVLEYEEESEGG